MISHTPGFLLKIMPPSSLEILEQGFTTYLTEFNRGPISASRFN